MNWKEFFDWLVIEDLQSWGQVQAAIRGRAQDFAAQWIAGDRKLMQQALKDALKDNKLSDKEVIGILAALAQSWEKDSFFGNQFVQRLLGDLKDGDLTSREIAESAAEWAVRRTSNDTLKQLIRAGVDGHLTRDEIEQAIIDWLERINRGALANRLRQALDSPTPLSLRSLVLLSTAYLIDTKTIQQAGSTVEKQRTEIVSAFNRLADSPLVPIIEALVDDDLPTAVKLLFRELGVKADDALIKAVLSGKLHDVLQDLLRKSLRRALSDLTDAQATALANTITGILKGELQLIPKQTEKDELGMGDQEFQVWLQVRRMVYAAMQGVAGGPLVPNEALAQPHVFAAAIIGRKTVVKTLAPEQQWPLLLELLKIFTRTEFNPTMDPPINMDSLRDGADVLFVHEQIRDNL